MLLVDRLDLLVRLVDRIVDGHPLNDDGLQGVGDDEPTQHLSKGGGGLASVISPAKLQNAAASIDRIGDEAAVLRVTFVVSLVITAVCAVMAMVWAF